MTRTDEALHTLNPQLPAHVGYMIEEPDEIVEGESWYPPEFKFLFIVLGYLLLFIVMGSMWELFVHVGLHVPWQVSPSTVAP